MTDRTAPPARVFAGTAGKAHGLDGSFYVVAAVPALLTKGTDVWVGAETEARSIERRAGTDEKPIIRLSGSADRTAAESFRGLTLEVSGANTAPLGDDEFWAHELVGCAVQAQDGRALGEVAELMALPSCEALVVRAPGEADTSGKADLLIPMVKDAIVEIDPATRVITVDAEFLALGEA